MSMLLLCFNKIQVSYLFQAAGDFKALDTIAKGDLAKKCGTRNFVNCIV